MIDFGRAREFMVDNQLRTSSITDWRILAQMSIVPRENFVAPERRDVAYIDDVQWLGEPGHSRFFSQPATLARLIQLGEINEHQDVLDIGCATGYSTAVLAGLCRSVVGLEENDELASRAQSNLAQLDIGNASVIVGDASALAGRQFDVVLVQGALEKVPEEFLACVKEGGRLVALIRKGAVAVAHVYVKTAEGIGTRAEFNASLPPLFAAKPKEEFVF